MCSLVLQTGLHMKGNVQGTDRSITLMDHYTLQGMYRDRQGCHTDRTLHMKGNVLDIQEYHTDRPLHMKGNVQGQTGISH